MTHSSLSPLCLPHGLTHVDDEPLMNLHEIKQCVFMCVSRSVLSRV